MAEIDEALTFTTILFVRQLYCVSKRPGRRRGHVSISGYSAYLEVTIIVPLRKVAGTSLFCIDRAYKVMSIIT